MRRWILAALTSVIMMIPMTSTARAISPHADGLGVCTSADPPYPFHGSCGTFNSHNTYYGSYGPGFPSPMGWGFCAFEAAHGGWYPAPGYNYSLGSAPAGADSSQWSELGWAMSEADRLGWWDSGNGTAFSADDLGVAGKLLYDNVTWGAPLPTLSGTLRSALNALKALLVQGRAIDATPRLSVALSDGTTTIYDSGTAVVGVLVPGTNAPVANQKVRLTLTGARFDANNSSVITLTTDASGNAQTAFSVPGSAPGTISLAAQAILAVPGMLFFQPSMFPDDAQILASAKNAITSNKSLSLTALGPPTGTVQIAKSVDDAAYYPATGAVFEILDSNNAVLDTLTVGSDGVTNTSIDLERGDYTLRELTPPPFYGTMSDKTITVVAGVNTIISVGPSDGDVITRASVSFEKVDAESHTPLSGAVFSLAFDATHSGTPTEPALTCTTDGAGRCGWNDLLPGNYQLSEVSAPSGYVISVPTQWITLAPGDAMMLRFFDDPATTTLSARKFNAAHRGVFIPHATYDLYVREPGPPTTRPDVPLDAVVFAGYSFMQRGVTDAQGRLSFTVRVGYRWCLHEVSAPEGYVVDPALHCSSTPSSNASSNTMVPEVASPIRLSLHKFSSSDITAGVPGAYYALFVRDTFPAGFTPAPTPQGLAVPSGMSLWAIAHTDAAGVLGFNVPSGSRWCVRELYAPAHYRLDGALHCTSVPLVTTSGANVTHLAVYEDLATTGASWPELPLAFLLSLLGGVLVLLGERLSFRQSR